MATALCPVVAACGRPLGHRGAHGAWRPLAPEPSPLRGDTLGHSLTPREMETMLVYARVGTIAETARLLGLAEQTVKNHMTRIYSKLGAHTWAEAMYVMGWIRIPTDEEAGATAFAERFIRVQDDIDALVTEARAIANGLEALGTR